MIGPNEKRDAANGPWSEHDWKLVDGGPGHCWSDFRCANCGSFRFKVYTASGPILFYYDSAERPIPKEPKCKI